MGKAYTMKIAGLERDLPLCEASDHLDIAAFIMFGDVELTQACATELLKKCPEHDVLLTAEAKGIPLCYEMARQENKPYLVCRKSKKVYMENPIGVEVKSITTKNLQQLFLGKKDIELMKGKKVLLVDDVISTGESLRVLESFVEVADGEIAAKVAVLAEGDAANRDDIVFLEKLPLFFK